MHLFGERARGHDLVKLHKRARESVKLKMGGRASYRDTPEHRIDRGLKRADELGRTSLRFLTSLSREVEP